MTGDDIGRMIYLLLLLLVIGGFFFVSQREKLGKSLQQAAIWALIFMGVIAVAGLWDDMRDDIAPRQGVIGDTGQIEVPLSMDGHYHLTLEINDQPVRFIIDTGATDMVLTAQDASRVGLDPERLAYLGRAQTANGTVPIARVTLDTVTLGGMTDRAVGASVNGGQMGTSLLGMTYLSRFGRIEISNGRLTLER